MIVYERKRKRIAKRLVVGLSVFLLAALVSGSTFPVLSRVLPERVQGNPFFWILLVTAFVTLIYPGVNRGYGWLFRHVFFPRRLEVVTELDRLFQELAQSSDLTELSNLLVNTLAELLPVKTVSLLVRAPQGEGYLIASASGWNVTGYRKIRLLPRSPLLELMKAAGPQPLVRERVVRSLSWQEANQVTKDFDELHATCVIPLWVKSELVGSINLLMPKPPARLEEEELRTLQDFAREVAGMVRQGVEIHKLRIANEVLQDAQSELVQVTKLQAIEQLATGIAHEIHNPLTIISGKAQVLLLQKDRKFYDEKVEEVLTTIVKQTRRAADITKKLLMFSRASALPRETLRLEDVVEDTLSLIAYQTSLEDIEIQRLIADGLPDFYGNVQELREIFLNLILNALQATGPGGSIQVGISFQDADQVFLLQVADNGPGMTPEHQEKAFNPFFTTRPEAIGLGLFVTQQIIHRYGGSIRLESELGHGTLFLVELPLEVPSFSPPAGDPVGEVAKEVER